MAVASLVAMLPSAAANAHEPEAPLPLPSPELLQPRVRTPAQPSMHPPITLRDSEGVAVVQSGGAASAKRTCDGCHDVPWIEAHDYHARAAGVTSPGRAPVRSSAADWAAGNCFLCHVRAADNRARVTSIDRGRAAWADTATLAGTDLVVESGDGWRWRKEAFAPDGSVSAATLGLARPNDRACGFCHGNVYQQPEPLLLVRDSSQRMTDNQGVVFSSQRISESAINLAGKDSLTRPWDVHAERMVACASCHFSPNHPAYSFANRGPEHLQFDARRMAITEYLRRPDHRLARGQGGAAGDRHERTLRRCEDCHDAPKVHLWLPRAERHFAAMLCESCHVPAAYAPARQETDWTMLTAARQPRAVYRGLRDDGFVTGYRPVLLARPQPDGTRKLAPSNLVTTWFWTENNGGGNQPIAQDRLERAFFSGADHRPELVRALDRNGDGKLQDSELVLDTRGKVELVRGLLVTAGALAPEITGETIAYDLHHGTSPGRFAVRECSACHTRDANVDAPLVLSSASPFAVTPTLVGGAKLAGEFRRDPQGQLLWQPKLAGLHVFGHSSNRILDRFGILVFVLTLAGIVGHASLRVRSARRRNNTHRSGENS